MQKRPFFHLGNLVSPFLSIFLWSSGKGQARIGKGWQSRRKASKLEPLPRAYTKFGCPTFLPTTTTTTTRKSNISNVYGWNGSGKVGRDNGRYIGAKWVMLLCWDGSHRGWRIAVVYYGGPNWIPHYKTWKNARFFHLGNLVSPGTVECILEQSGLDDEG